MQPTNHLSNLNGFFSRHDIPVPGLDAPLIERLGLTIHMAGCLRATDFSSGLRGDRSMVINGFSFTEAEWSATLGPAGIAAHTFEAIEQGLAPEHNGAPIDRMALLMRRAEANDITVDADMLAREGYPSHLITEYAVEAAQLAETMKAAEQAYLRGAKRREREAEMAAAIREAA